MPRPQATMHLAISSPMVRNVAVEDDDVVAVADGFCHERFVLDVQHTHTQVTLGVGAYRRRIEKHIRAGNTALF